MPRRLPLLEDFGKQENTELRLAAKLMGVKPEDVKVFDGDTPLGGKLWAHEFEPSGKEAGGVGGNPPVKAGKIKGVAVAVGGPSELPWFYVASGDVERLRRLTRKEPKQAKASEESRSAAAKAAEEAGGFETCGMGDQWMRGEDDGNTTFISADGNTVTVFQETGDAKKKWAADGGGAGALAKEIAGFVRSLKK